MSDSEKTKEFLIKLSKGLNNLLQEKLKKDGVVLAINLFIWYLEICPEDEKWFVEYLCGKADMYSGFVAGDVITIGE